MKSGRILWRLNVASGLKPPEGARLQSGKQHQQIPAADRGSPPKFSKPSLRVYLESVQIAKHGERDLLLIEERLRDPLHVVGCHHLDAFPQFIEREERPKYISWRARFDMRLEVDSRLSISDPLRWSLARRILPSARYSA